jgi:hypothetical protein
MFYTEGNMVAFIPIAMAAVSTLSSGNNGGETNMGGLGSIVNLATSLLGGNRDKESSSRESTKTQGQGNGGMVINAENLTLNVGGATSQTTTSRPATPASPGVSSTSTNRPPTTPTSAVERGNALNRQTRDDLGLQINIQGA